MPRSVRPSLPLDDPGRIDALRLLIKRKTGLRQFYVEIYEKYRACLARCPQAGLAIELGSGAGFVKELNPEIITSDTVAYAGVDMVLDATKLPFADSSVRALFLLNVFHHIPDVQAFLAEASRCLVPQGRIFIVDQHVGPVSRLIFKYLHHEPFDTEAEEWRFESSGPLSGANGALAWLVFQRDQAKFKKLFPDLRVEAYRRHSPMRYWLAGGLKSWSLLPGFSFGMVTAVERGLLALWPDCASFVDVELVKIAR